MREATLRIRGGVGDDEERFKATRLTCVGRRVEPPPPTEVLPVRAHEDVSIVERSPNEEDIHARRASWPSTRDGRQAVAPSEPPLSRLSNPSLVVARRVAVDERHLGLLVMRVDGHRARAFALAVREPGAGEGQSDEDGAKDGRQRHDELCRGLHGCWLSLLAGKVARGEEEETETDGQGGSHTSVRAVPPCRRGRPPEEGACA